MTEQLGESEIEALKAQLAVLKNAHRELDAEIAQITEDGLFDQIHIQRLKKRKLALKDDIARLESRLLPDIIA